MLLELTFWMSLGLILYAYFGYPILLAILACFRTREVLKKDITPFVTFIITAYNEESRIKEKLNNTCQIIYPVGRLEVIVASDCSSDRTDEIVLSYGGNGIRLVRAPVRKGKEAAQKLAVQAAQGEILVFSDVATILPSNAIATMVRNFGDPSVGCVSSIDRFIEKDGTISGEGAYLRYEMWLRSLESQAYSLVGLSGSFFAARRELCREWMEDLQSDFNTLLNCIKQGKRGVLDSCSIGYYANIKDERKEFERKTRTVLRGIAVLANNIAMLNPFRYGIFAWELFSHKLCRWLVPFALCIALATNVMLVHRGLTYVVILILQGGVYCSAIAWLALGQRTRAWKFLQIPSFFVIANASILLAWFRYMKGDRITLWSPSSRD
jgi:glycosyltransferase involved in cell wall biosynthesis